MEGLSATCKMQFCQEIMGLGLGYSNMPLFENSKWSSQLGWTLELQTFKKWKILPTRIVSSLLPSAISNAIKI